MYLVGLGSCHRTDRGNITVAYRGNSRKYAERMARRLWKEEGGYGRAAFVFSSLEDEGLVYMYSPSPCVGCPIGPRPLGVRPKRRIGAVIVSPHPAMVAFIDAELARLGVSPEHIQAIPVLGGATPAQVEGKVVFGNVPLSLAAAASYVITVECAGEPPRAGELSVEAIRQAGGYLARYQVVSLPTGILTGEIAPYLLEDEKD